MIKYYRNVVCVGFNHLEQQVIKIIDTRKLKNDWSLMNPNFYRFPYVLYFNSLEEALKHQGFVIFIKNNNQNDIVYFKKHLKKLNTNYYHVILCTKNESIELNEKYETILESKLYNEKIVMDLRSWYYKYLQSMEKKEEITNKIKMNHRKGHKALELKTYFDNKDHVTSKEIAEHFNIPLRTAQRYVKYMKDIFDNVVYDAKTKTWIKKI